VLSRPREAMRGFGLGLLLSVAATALGAAPGRAEIGDRWADLERSLAVFDPVGQHVIRPIEEAFPGLALSGSYSLWSDTFLGGSQQVGFRDKDYRMPQGQNLLELELRYRVTPGVEITSINHLLYDSAYDMQDADGLYADRTEDEFRIYDDADRIARELYVSFRTPRLDVVIGKQQIAWGKMDGRFIDVINGFDLRESVQLESSDYEVRRMPAWMANVTYFFGRASLNFLWIPDFEGNFSPTYGSPWFSRLVPPDDAVAARNRDLREGQRTAFGDTIRHDRMSGWGPLNDHEYALRLDVQMGALTWGGIYYYAWAKSPEDAIVGREVGASGVPNLVFERRHSRLRHFGFTADYASALRGLPLVGDLPVVARAEALLTHDVPFTDYDKQSAARAGSDTSGLSRRDTLRAAIALELAFPMNTTVILQPSLYYTFGWRKSFGPGFGGAFGDEWALVPILFIERPIRATRDRLRLSGTITPYFSGPERGFQGAKTRLVAAWEFSQFITGKLIYTAYTGGDRDDAYGQYRNWDNVGVELKYEF
jgi:hypothetical protein